MTLSLALAPLQAQPSLTGTVVDAQTGRPVARVAVVIDGDILAQTDDAGRFGISARPGAAQLILTAVGYALVKRTLTIAAGVNDLGTIALNPESRTITERVTVTSARPSDAGPAPLTLTRADLQALSTVLVDDPLRSVHALPGVVANNDLRAEFSLRGAAFDQVGVYLDGIRTVGFVHTLSDSGTTDQLSLSIVNQDTIAAATLVSGVAAASTGGGTAGVLDLETREGNRERRTAQFSTGFLATSGLVEGPLPSADGSWLVAARTTRADYVQQLVDRATRGRDTDEGSELQFDDLLVKAAFDPASRHHFTLMAVAGRFTNVATDADAVPDPNAVGRARSGNWLRSAAWRFTPSARIVTDVRLFSVGSTYREQAFDASALFESRRTGTGIRADVTMQAGRDHLVRAGVYAQSVSEETTAIHFSPAGESNAFGSFSARRFEPSWYGEDRWTPATWLTATGGVRVDRAGGETMVAPRLAATAALNAAWTIRGSAGIQYQPGSLSAMHGLLGNPALRAARSTEIDLGLEHRLSDQVTVTVDAYRRLDRGHPFALAEPRREAEQIVGAMHAFENSLDADAHGFEAAIRRAATNRVGGWIGYAYSTARATVRETPVHDTLRFPTDADQRHTLNAFGSYRLSGTASVSAQWRYGSGTPRPGFFRRSGDTLELGPERNLFRLTPYARLDLKMRKTWLWKDRTLMLSGEVLNVLNRKNEYNVTSTLLSLAETGRYSSGQRRSFGVVPALGLSFQF
jgi:hypothetical protein